MPPRHSTRPTSSAFSNLWAEIESGAKLHRRQAEEEFSRLEKGEQGGALTRLADGPQLFSAVRR
jgi:hypothetical protein